jgi:hypothetical protein
VNLAVRWLPALVTLAALAGVLLGVRVFGALAG